MLADMPVSPTIKQERVFVEAPEGDEEAYYDFRRWFLQYPFRFLEGIEADAEEDFLLDPDTYVDPVYFWTHRDFRRARQERRRITEILRQVKCKATTFAVIKGREEKMRILGEVRDLIKKGPETAIGQAWAEWTKYAYGEAP